MIPLYGTLVIDSKELFAYKHGDERRATKLLKIKTEIGTKDQVCKLLRNFLYDFINSDDWRILHTNREQEIYSTAQRVLDELKTTNRDYISLGGGGRVMYEYIRAHEFDLLLKF